MNQKDAMEYVLLLSQKLRLFIGGVINQKRGYTKNLIDAIGEENFKTLSLLGVIPL